MKLCNFLVQNLGHNLHKKCKIVIFWSSLSEKQPFTFKILFGRLKTLLDTLTYSAVRWQLSTSHWQAQWCASDAQPFILRMVWTLVWPPSLPSPNHPNIWKAIDPFPTICSSKGICSAKQNIFLLSLFFVWFARAPPVWSSRNNNSDPGGQILKS